MKIAIISDIHFGVKDSEKLYKELQKNFIQVLYEKKPDITFIAGDLFHTKLMVNSIHNQMCNAFIHDFSQIPGLKVLVEGTFLHDQFQLKSFNHYLSNDFRIFLEAGILHYQGLKFLILPEENMLNYKTYYNELLKKNKEYDFVIGHGMFSHVGSYTKHETTKTKVLWHQNQFEDIKGLVIFGHIHTRTEYKNVFYPGSFSRDSFGEEEEKGFYFIEYNKNKVKKVEFIVNKDAPVYKSINFKEIPTEIKEMEKFLYKEIIKCYQLRIVIDDEIDDSFYNNLLAFQKNSKNISIIKKKARNYCEPEVKTDRYIENQKRLAEFKGKDIVEITKIIAERDYNMSFTNEEINTILNEN